VSEAGHRYIEHTADLALEVWGANEPIMLAEACRAVIEVLTEAAPLAGTHEHPISLDAIDRGDRLVRLLNEVLYLALVNGFLTIDAKLALHDGGLSGKLVGEAHAADKIRTEIKAATYHDLQVTQTPTRMTARVVLDV